MSLTPLKLGKTEKLVTIKRNIFFIIFFFKVSQLDTKALRVIDRYRESNKNPRVGLITTRDKLSKKKKKFRQESEPGKTESRKAEKNKTIKKGKNRSDRKEMRVGGEKVA